MGDVTDIAEFRQKRPEYVFECKCTSQMFYLHADGTIECRSCKRVDERIEWMYREGREPQPKERT